MRKPAFCIWSHAELSYISVPTRVHDKSSIARKPETRRGISVDSDVAWDASNTEIDPPRLGHSSMKIWS